MADQAEQHAELVAAATDVFVTARCALDHYKPWDLVDWEWIAIWKPLVDSLKELERALALIDGDPHGS